MINNLSDNLKTLRLNKGYSLAEIADLIGLKGKTSYYAYEINKAEPGIDRLIKLANIFGVSIDELILSKIKIIDKSDSEKNQILIQKYIRKIQKIKDKKI